MSVNIADEQTVSVCVLGSRFINIHMVEVFARLLGVGVGMGASKSQCHQNDTVQEFHYLGSKNNIFKKYEKIKFTK